MIIKHESEVPYQKVEDPKAQNVYIKWLIGKDSPAPHFHLRQLQVMPRGHTPLHQHPYEHEVYILRGQGMLVREGGTVSLEPGTFALIPPDVKHQFRNPTAEVLEFLCLIPKM